jgi:hypothetical protein
MNEIWENEKSSCLEACRRTRSLFQRSDKFMSLSSSPRVTRRAADKTPRDVCTISSRILEAALSPVLNEHGHP